MNQPFISICIPAYKNRDFLKRLLDSIAIQSFADFEVVISDDSPDETLLDLVNSFGKEIRITYYRNHVPLGSPLNWNKSISLAKGEWIKIMHDDDWFSNTNSLKLFADVAKTVKTDFIFSGYINVDLATGEKKEHIITIYDLKRISQNPLYLFRTNYIGHPSTTLIRNTQREWFDDRVKWVVDFEFYIRALKQGSPPNAIRLPLISIGVSSEQITRQVFRNPSFEVPENIYLLKRLGEDSLANIFVYDYYWRLIRNLEVRKLSDLSIHLPKDESVPDPVVRMILVQRIIPLFVLKIGVVSKIMMFFNWCIYMLKRK